LGQSGNNEESMSFWSHFEDLRWLLLRLVLIWFVVCIIVFINKTFVFNNIFLAPKEGSFITNQAFAYLAELLSIDVLNINQTPIDLINIKMGGQFWSHIFISVVFSIVIMMPYIMWEVWSFIKPGLYAEEKKRSRGFVAVCSFLFILGVLFGYYIVLPLSINFLGHYQVSEMVSNQISLCSYINNVASLTLGLGIVFEFPVLVFYLAKMGIVSPSSLRKSRKIVFVIVLMLSAIITPPDVFSQIFVSIPLMILYELSVFISGKMY
jgi:sec-independent protein translocase protein TatC